MGYARHRSVKGMMGCVLLMLIFAIVPGGLLAEEMPKQLVIGYQSFPTAEIVVKDLGWNEKELGIPVKWVPVSSGMQAHEGLSAGDLDIALLGSSPSAAGVARGIPLEVIWIHDIIGDNEALVVQKNSGIEQVAHLAGKKVAAPFGSTTDYHLQVALMLAGVKKEEVTIVHLEPEEILAAWNQNMIDAAFVWVPVLSRLTETGGKVILTSRQIVERGFPTADLCVVRKDFGEKYPSLVIKYLKTLDKAVKYCRSHPQEAAAAVSRQLGMSPAEAARQMKGVILLTAKEQDAGRYFGGTYWNFGLYTLLKETADFLKKGGVIESLPPRDAFLNAVNASFLVKALDE